MTKFLNISTDNTLGGNLPSDETVSSQKAIKEYVDNHGGSASADGVTINTNSSDELQAIGLINKNPASGATNPKYDWVGTLQEYETQSVATAHPDWICYITDDAITSSSGRCIGEIITSTIPLEDAGLHLLDGALIANGAYAGFVDYISGLVSNYPDLFTTEANWQQSVTTYGVCGKFVYDSVNNTVRLPKITGFTEGTTDVTALGDLVQAGLPNITGYFEPIMLGNTPTGCFDFNERGRTVSTSGSNCYYGKTGFKASDSNSIYGNSTTVQPQAIKVLYYIVIATSAKTEIEVDIDEIATDLNGKADVDLSNVLANIDYVVESKYPTANDPTWYRVYKSGWVEQGGLVSNIGTGKQITFTKEFIDTNYSFLASELSGSGGGVNAVGSEYVGSTKRTTSSTWVYVSNNNTQEACFWEAKGMGVQ